MSVVVSVYTNSAFRDYLLPAIHNSNYDMILKSGVFALEEDVILKLEIIDGRWRLLESENYRIVGETTERKALSDGDIFNVETAVGENISCIVRETTQSFTSFVKYDLTDVVQLSIGSTEQNDFQYKYVNFVSKQHAILQRAERGFAIRDVSLNGTFVNYKKIDGMQSLRVGDCINIFGLKIVYLGNSVAVSSIDDAVLNVNAQLKELVTHDANAEPVKLEEQKVFHRAPRFYMKPEEEEIEIEAPPTPKSVAKKPLWMTIGPSFTMVIPMLLGSIVAIASASSSGNGASIYMFTGIFTAASSAIVGAFWAVTNIKYTGKEAAKEERLRQEMYGAYLEERERSIKEKYDKYSDVLREMYPPANEVVNYDHTSTALWNRNRRHDDFLCPRIGIGETEFPVEITIPRERFTMFNDELADKPGQIKEKYKYLHGVPIKLDLFSNRLFGVVGGKDKNGCYEFMQTLVAQLAACDCYSDVKLVLVYDKGKDNGDWGYAYWLPHVWSEDKKLRYIATNKMETSDLFYELLQIFRMRTEAEQSGKNALPKPYYVMVIANPELLEGEPIAKYIMNGEPCCGVTTFLLTDLEENLPNECENIIKNNEYEQTIYNVSQEKVQTVVFDRVSNANLEAFARRILSIRVNEAETGNDVANSLTFFEMYGANQLADFNVADNWKKNRTYDTMKAMIGTKAGGTPCYLDIHEKYHGPHGLVAGTTGSGKSETLQTYMLSLALNFSPDDIGFFIIDFKGGGMAGLFDGLPHLIGSISNLSGNQVRRAMISIKSENKRRQRIFNENNVNNINLYTKLYKNGEVKTPLPHMFIIVDEFAELKREEPEFMKELISVAQVGRSLGVHLILSTQKPSGTVDDNIWSNSKFRLCLRVQDKQDSNDMLHKPDAAYITQTGRGYLQVGSDEVYELFQSGYSGAIYDGNVESMKSEVASMIATNGRTSLIGSHQKRIQQEQAKRIWIEKLVTCIAKAMDECGQDMDEFVHNDNRAELVFEQIERSHIAYDRSSYNAKRVESLITAVNMVLEKEEEASVRKIAEMVVPMSEMTGIKLPEEKKKTQLDAVVEYLADIAKAEGYTQQMQLWMPPLPPVIYTENIIDTKSIVFDGSVWKEHTRWMLRAVIGITDDPENQAQLPLEVDIAESGNIAVFGSILSGKSTFLQTVLYGLVMTYAPSWLWFYALDFSSHMLSSFAEAPHCGGVLYEDDDEKIDKLFFLLGNMISERKKLFRGGNYVQYVKANGVELPMVLVVIDNLGAFREKTDGKYDDKLTQLMKEGISYGVQFIVTATGFASAEVNTKMADSFKTTFTLQLNDKYAYCDALRTMQIDVLPENNTKGRGLARVGAKVLEYQTALAFAAADDYCRLEAIAEACTEMRKAWEGAKARVIPIIPEKPVWSEFEMLDDYRELVKSDRYVPIGYDMESAGVYGIDLAKTFLYLISGKNRTGKTNLQKAVLTAAGGMNAEIAVIEHSSSALKGLAQTLGAEYISSKAEQASFFEKHLEEIVSRNKKKKVLEESGMDENEIYDEMRKERPIFIVIADLAKFILSLGRTNGENAAIKDITPFIKNLFEKGSGIRLYFFIGINQDSVAQVLGNELYIAATAYRGGVHLGGAADSVKYMDFSQFTYAERSRVRKAGVAMLPSANEEKTKEIVIPLVKR